MYTIQQDSANKIVIPFNGTDYDFLLIVFSYSCYESVGIFENVAGIGCDYEIVVNEVGSNGTSDPENGDVKISPRSTWKGEVYGQDNNVNLFPQYAAFIEDYKFQVKGDSCNVYPNLSPQIDCLPSTAIVQDQDGNELARENIASGAQQIITVNVQTMINVAKGDFTGVFDLSVTDQNGFYNDYTEGSVINTLSLAASPKLGSIATVRILGGLLGDNAIPEDWDNFSIDAISQDNSQFNVLTILYVAADDVRIVNNVIAAPDFAAPEFTSAPTATNIEETSFDITAQLNENGTVYGYLLADGSPVPTVQEIIDNAQSQFTDSGSGGTLSFTGLNNETNYDVYVVAVDTAGNRQADSTLVEVITQTQDLVALISPEFMYHKFDIATTNASTVTSSTDSLTQTPYNMVNNGSVIRAIQNTKECVYLNGSGYMQTTANSLSSLFQNTFSFSFFAKLEDGNPSIVSYFTGISADSNNRWWLDIRTDGKLTVQYRSAGVATNAQTLNSVFADGAMTDFKHIAVVIPSGGTIQIYIDGVLQTLSATLNGNMSSINMSLFNSGAKALPFGFADITVDSGNAPSGYYRGFTLQPVAYTQQDVDNLRLL